MIDRPGDPATTDRVRQLAVALGGVEERLSHGEKAWFARGRQFATMSDHHHDDRLAIWLAAPAGRQEASSRPIRRASSGHRTSGIVAGSASTSTSLRSTGTSSPDCSPTPTAS